MQINRLTSIGKTICLAFGLLLIVFPAFSQRTITGTITAGDSGESLPSANVFIKGTTRGVISDLDGNYTITVQSGDEILVYSFIGYLAREVEIGDLTNIDITLELETVGIDEIVVIGYGKVKKSDLTGSVSSVKSEDIIKITSMNPEQSLQGKVPGVQVTSTSGAPGAGTVVRIRGVGTFNNSSPIYVVDGVILDDISFLNAADISSMEVLKDASATAIYGSRGANGVIIITSKTGTLGQTKPSFNFLAEYGLQKVAKKIDLLNGKEFAIISNQIKPGSYNNVDVVPNTDWQDLVFNTAPQQNYQFSMTGATNQTQYYVGVGALLQDGIIDKSNFQRITLKLNNTGWTDVQFISQFFPREALGSAGQHVLFALIQV